MPAASHPQAKFDPIPPDLDLDALVENTSNFEWALRVPAAKINRLGPQGFEKLVLLHVIQGGKPLVIEKWNDRLPRSLFSAQWLESTNDKREESVRDIGSASDMRMTIGHYLRSMRQLTDQWTPTNFQDDRRQRLYLKDIDCPPEWHDRLQRILPPNTFYMNANVDERGTRNDDDEFAEHSTAPAGDLMSSLPEPMRAQNLMCYIGHEGTYTPAHREMCASLGQNIMVDASGSDNGEKPGSSIWFMTETKDREVIAEYFLSMLGHDIEIEKHFAQINAWKKATFPVYVVEQKLGDFILVPPLAPHQVWNRGTRTMKVAWNRTTVETLEMALNEALPKARLVCRDEQYKNKAIIYYTLQRYHRDILNMEENDREDWLGIGQDLVKTSARAKQMMRDFKKLFTLFTKIMVDEMFGSHEKNVEFIEFDSNITCSYCRANIFNRFLTCKHCVRTLIDGDEDTYDVCMECYAMGRSCQCVSKLSWCEQWEWSKLVDDYETWRTMITTNDGYVDIHTSPLPLEVERRKTGFKSVAQICQEQLRRRPFTDITKPAEPEPLEPEDQELDAERRPVKKAKKRGRKFAGQDQYRCHVCCHRHPTYMLAFCTNHGCAEAYCYGTLWRAFDLPPQDVMKSLKWKCPKCLRICNCGQCRRSKVCVPYTPKSTMLGHDTRRIADDRSRENLVDFRVHNLGWIKALGEESRSQDTGRMRKLKEQADAEKAKAGPAKDVANHVLASGDAPPHGEVANGYGDRRNVLDSDPVDPASALPMAVGSTRLDEAGPSAAADHLDAHGEPEDLSLLNGGTAGLHHADAAAPSAYPDPSDVAQRERMPGLAYYQQDDSPDKILFDEYEMPSVEAFEFDEENDNPGFDKKALRAAKRKARLENEDPDFQGPRSHHRKKQKLDKDAAVPQASLDNLDPALLDGSGDASMNDAPANDGEGPSTFGTSSNQEGAAATSAGQTDGNAPQPPSGYGPYEANVPSLRHAKPMVSYVEPDEAEALEEFNEVLPLKEPVIAGNNPTSADPLDLAAEAIRAIAGQANGLEEPQGQAKASIRDALRKRGRPRAIRHSERLAPAVSKESAHRPRQSRTSMLASQGLDRNPTAEDAEDAEDADHAADSSDIEAQLAAELDDAENRRASAAQKRPNYREAESDDSAIPEREPALASTPATAPKQRGRPPKQRPSEGATTTPGSTTAKAPDRPSPSVGTPQSKPVLLSMAERMALKGKKFTMGKSNKPKPSPSGTATPDRARETTVATVELDLGTKKPAQDKPAEDSQTRDQTGDQPQAAKSATAAPASRDTSADEDEAFVTPPARDSSSSGGPSRPTSISFQVANVPRPAPAAAKMDSPRAPARAPVPAPAPTPGPKKPAPTVVRLGDSDDSDEDDFVDDGDDDNDDSDDDGGDLSLSDVDDSDSDSDSDSDDDDDDEDDIHANKPGRMMAMRGRPMGVAVRGRGRPRGTRAWRGGR